MLTVYKIESIETGKCYFGSTSDVKRRFYQHVYQLETNTHNNGKLQHEYNLYGKAGMQFSILETYENMGYGYTLEAKLIEIYLKINPDYVLNIRPGFHRDLAVERKEKILRCIQKPSESHINKDLRDLARWLRDYISPASHSYDREFRERLLLEKPKWFVRLEKPADQKKPPEKVYTSSPIKDFLLTLPSKPRLSNNLEERKHWRCLVNYIDSTSRCYDPIFAKKVKQLWG